MNVIMMIGPSGSGKSTLARKIVSQIPGIQYECCDDARHDYALTMLGREPVDYSEAFNYCRDKDGAFKRYWEMRLHLAFTNPDSKWCIVDMMHHMENPRAKALKRYKALGATKFYAINVLVQPDELLHRGAISDKSIPENFIRGMIADFVPVSPEEPGFIDHITAQGSDKQNDAYVVPLIKSWMRT